MTKEQFIAELNVWISRIEEGEILGDIECDDVVDVREILNSLADDLENK